jgi:uncharacterized protein YcbX
MHVAALYRYPVKSMQGEPVDQVTFTATRALGDREWGVIDVVTGRVLSAKRWPALLFASAWLDPRRRVVNVRLPDDSVHAAGDASTDAALSAWLDRDVALRPADPGSGATYEMYSDATDDSSDIFEFTGPPGHYADLAPAHLLTTASLAAAAALYPEGQWEVRRFRPTALIEADGDEFVEDSWVGTTVRLGGATELAPFMPTVRCSMTTRAQPGDLPRDTTIAKTLNHHHSLNLGVYCGVTTPGEVRLGDAVEVSAPA